MSAGVDVLSILYSTFQNPTISSFSLRLSAASLRRTRHRRRKDETGTVTEREAAQQRERERHREGISHGFCSSTMSNSNSGTEDDKISISLTLTAVPTAARQPLEISKSVTASELRKQASEATKIPLGSMRLIFGGRLIADNDKKIVDEYKVTDGSVIHCMGKPVQEVAVSPVSAAASATTAAVSGGSTVSVAAAASSSSSSAATSTSAATAAASASTPDTLDSALNALRLGSTQAAYTTAVTTLGKMVDNIVANPQEEKYRRVKIQNASFQKRVGSLPSAPAVMTAIGFQRQTLDTGDDAFVLHPSPEAWPALVQAKAKLQQEVTSAKAATAAPPPPAMAFPPAPSSNAATPGMDPASLMGAGMTPQMQQAAQSMLSNPSQLQAALQNPMVQQMLQNDPRFRNNPMLQQGVSQLAQNPQMLQQLGQFMNSGGMGAMPPASNNNNNTATTSTQQQTNQQQQQQQSSSSGANDEGATEEEMLQEAIRRSLQDS